LKGKKGYKHSGGYERGQFSHNDAENLEDSDEFVMTPFEPGFEAPPPPSKETVEAVARELRRLQRERYPEIYGPHPVVSPLYSPLVLPYYPFMHRER
jgi:hypothetical protein